MAQPRAIKLKEGELFFRRWLSSPKSMGSVWPSSQALARAVACRAEYQPGDTIIELGGGTGAITQGLIERGIPRERIAVVELDPSLVDYLEDRLPGCRIIQGDATKLGDILDRCGINRVGTVVSGLPMVRMPRQYQRAIIHQGLAALRPGGTMLQYSYSPLPPVPTEALGITARLATYVPWNLPPASVWRYERQAS
jgi:phosphatidylethanolamine/phosphatidyl-N-methylethanolamine N-methyltransferase